MDALDSRYLPLVLDVLDQGVFTVDEATRITSFNHAAEQITGYSASEVIGRPCSSVFRTDLCDQVCPLRLSIQSRSPVRNRQVYIRAQDERPVPISVSTAPLVTRTGELIGGVEVFKDLSGLRDMRRRLEERYRLQDIIGKSAAMQQVFQLIPLVAESDSTALVTGASGTGKELAARTIHALGPRKDGPFVPINCAAIPETLLESELFGHVRGAFTGARQRSGLVAAAEKGTLFLDEIGDLPRPMQVKVLRFLQDHEYSPVGSDRSHKADVRVIAATHRDLQRMVRDGDFREDLYFRLDVIQVAMPPLSERAEDIPLLVRHFVSVLRERTGKAIQGLTEEAMASILAHPFPGNVRELENMLERAFIVCQGSRIRPEHLPPAVREGADARGSAPDRRGADAHGARIRAALERHRGNRTRAAEDLGIHRVTLYRRMRKLGID
ncbi:MAG: sigma-54 interaction domain-containing protein [Myxococcota bacterium]